MYLLTFNRDPACPLTSFINNMPRVKRAAAAEHGAKRVKPDLDGFFSKLVDFLEGETSEDGLRPLITAFVVLPAKKEYPDYYEMIQEPISLKDINKKISKGQYVDTDLFIADFQLMLDNAVTYNTTDSWIVEDARRILTIVEQKINDFEAGIEFQSAPSSIEVPKLCLDLLDDVIAHEFPGDGVLSGPFLEDLDRAEYPDYFKIVTNPTSFSRVKLLLPSLLSDSKSLDANLQTFFDATMLIFHNAQTYNDPSSLIYGDSKKLEHYFADKFAELKSNLEDSEAAGALLEYLTSNGGLETVVKSEEPPKKRRGRKPKKLVEEERRKQLEEARARGEIPESDDGDEDNRGNATEANVLGKTEHKPPLEEVFIRDVCFSSSQTNANQQLTNFSTQAQFTLNRAQRLKEELFSNALVFNAATFFEYSFAANGYSTKAYSISLPSECSPAFTLRVNLHNMIYNLKKKDIKEGQGLLKGKTEENFMFTLYVNDEEFSEGCELLKTTDPLDGKTDLLGLKYDTKLNYGLNVLKFELRLAPTLAKKLKTEPITPQQDLGSRHTRHQMQQIKLNWEVEKFVLFINAPCL